MRHDVESTALHIAQRLKAERLRLGKKPADVAALCGVDKSTVYNYESGVRCPDALYLVALMSHQFDVWFVLTGKRFPKDRTPRNDAAALADAQKAMAAFDHAVGKGPAA